MRKPVLIKLAAAVWLAATVAGTWLMLGYANAPGATGVAPAQWPAAGGAVRTPGRPLILLFVHPHCPCSRASLGELALLLAQGGPKADARVVFLNPAGQPADWVKTDLWTAAAAIPGVTVVADADGRSARAFGSATSGDALLYDGAGRLLFHGGITVARGHSGDNPGRSALDALLRGKAGRVATPVFGCPLFGKNEEDKTCQR